MGNDLWQNGGGGDKDYSSSSSSSESSLLGHLMEGKGIDSSLSTNAGKRPLMSKKFMSSRGHFLRLEEDIMDRAVAVEVVEVVHNRRAGAYKRLFRRPRRWKKIAVTS
jgi:hypothetical protein